MKMTNQLLFLAVAILAPQVHSAPASEATETPAVLPVSSTLKPIEVPSPQPELPEPVPTGVPDCKVNCPKETTDVYDYSQNGTDNYRVKVSGFTFLIAPTDAILGAAMLMNGMDEEDKKVVDAKEASNLLRAHPKERNISKLFQFLKQMQHEKR